MVIVASSLAFAGGSGTSVNMVIGVLAMNSNLKLRFQSVVPLLRTFHVLTNGAPAGTTVSSGMVTSSRKARLWTGFTGVLVVSTVKGSRKAIGFMMSRG